MGIMGLFNKKELAKIAELERENTLLKQRIEALSPFEPILNVTTELNLLREEYDSLRKQYSIALNVFQNLRTEISAYEEYSEMIEYGLYKPHFKFETSEKFKDEIAKVRDKQKEMIKDGLAAIGGDRITWNDSLAQGAAMVKREKQLMLRAFNGECDSFIASVDWNNILRMEDRIEKSFNAINRVYKTQGVSLSPRYKSLKLDELRLTHEYHVKRHEEQEEQRAIREQMREEEKAMRDAERARQKAEKEQQTYMLALEKARKELGTAAGEQQEKLLSRIAELEAGLVNAETLKQKAISMAQQTKMGYVYVISNIGSFGEDVYKIGMTRRLEPMDRVRELGDASVPFPFDVHAMIFSEDAPAMESALHSKFDGMRVNMINLRKEFFHVPLHTIEQEAKKMGATVEFTLLAEAREYRETQQVLSSKMKSQSSSPSQFPSSI